ncbi:hypothetical protein [Dyadobacter sp. NIV53]|uniref:hypothetical protein n=1 Tax=Dyadobacter sp. NIV53 TaxID=2861765 RepID=UPI001C86E2D4|nr:hypothetical protein [Dyadobacter sp. NIV53]
MATRLVMPLAFWNNKFMHRSVMRHTVFQVKGSFIKDLLSLPIHFLPESYGPLLSDEFRLPG